MITVEKIDTKDKAQAQRFINIPYRLYKNHPQWVPPLVMDTKAQMDRDKHPFYEHSCADFFIASRDGRDVGRVTALENRRFNECHGTHEAQFYLFECEDDQEAANALIEQVCEWARKRGLDHIVGPKGFSSFDGYGILVEGFEHRQMMTMMNYNYPYYPRLLETIGFTKEVDFVSCYLSAEKFKMPERVYNIARRVIERGTLQVHRFKTKNDLRAWAQRIGEAYNKTFVNNWEYYPLTEREIKFVLDTLLQVADPRLIKIITHKEAVVGFLLAFPDVSPALQRARGHVNPLSCWAFPLKFGGPNGVPFIGPVSLPDFQG
ncbi:MAG: hypothetical protein EHM70_16545, partial [Chloroflexota bacterium]